jgi:hypothetical protein
MLAAMRAASWMAFEPLLESGDLRAERSARSGTKTSDHRHCRLLRARRERPRHCRAAEQRDELAAFQLIELHSIPASQGRVAGYRIASDQSAGMLEFCNHSWFCLRWRATARYTFGTMNAQIERCSRPRPRHTWQWWS